MPSRIPREHWEEIARLYGVLYSDMLPFASRLLGVDCELAHDTVQDTFKACAEAWDELQELGFDRQRSWLYLVLRRRIFDVWRARTTSRMLFEDLVRDFDPVADVDIPRTVASKMLLEKTWKIIDEMPERRRRVTLMKHQGHLSNQEIAAHLGITEGTVRVHLLHARADLTSALGQEVLPDLGDLNDDGGVEAAG
ncbi:RNA polymerase sigma factor (sigma-70 family) [Streptacidiphilus sp. MAP12-16]|jgi:RNA polymerase sigma factor (sigma-70 family)|uniref:RNA polymerase sigma factor n=1 Tax=Streptacidiphilus sp. MAP12-16 TaxID=3156300 RepID=UPI003512E1D4